MSTADTKSSGNAGPDTHNNGPLKGIRILDIGTMVAAPLAAGVLADQGAEVIKVEPPGIGDLMRYVGATCNGVSALFQNVNRGKRSIAVDLKSPEGLSVVQRLSTEVDVILHNFRPGVAERLGVDYATLAALNPELIYLSVSGFGHSGPMAGKAAYDNVVQAFAGVALSQPELSTGEPAQYQQLFADKLTALYASQAITAALLARERGEGGQHIQLAMVDAVASFLWADVAGTAGFRGDGADPGMQISKGVPLLKFKNGYAQAAPVSDANFHGWCAAFGVDSSDPRLASIMQRNANRDAVAEVSRQVFARALELGVDETIAKLEAADVPCAKAYALEDLPEHEQMQANGLFVNTEHPQAGHLVEPKTPANFSATPASRGFPCATLGAHSAQILVELGFSDDEIQSLRERNAIG
ncbi:MAG: CaiB/BaiF CoA-transferase family protein [Halioglobus sp.]|nr:CaiB/BaiF CoA-transferase family protein [Halioglobus sp.]